MKKLMSTCTALLLALCMLLPAYSAFAATDNDKIGERLEKVASQTEGATNYLYKNKDFGVADAVDMLAAVRNYDASDAQVELRLVEARAQGPDHPILWNVPETDYLKFYLFQVV